MIDYINNSSKIVRTNFILIFTSILIFFLWHTVGLGDILPRTHMHISLGHIGYFVLLILPAYKIFGNKKLNHIWLLFMSISILDMAPMVYIANNKSINQSIIVNGSFLPIVFFLILVSILYSIATASNLPKSNISSKNILAIYFSTLFFILAYHGINYFLKIYFSTPNEGRSFYIDGLEIHHINFGILLLSIVPFLFGYASKAKKEYSFLVYIFIGFIYGTVFDECFYYLLVNMSDEAYYRTDIFFGQIFFMSSVFVFWFIVGRAKKS